MSALIAVRELPRRVVARRRSAQTQFTTPPRVKVPKPHQSKTGAGGLKSTTQKQTSWGKKLVRSPRGPCLISTAVSGCSLGSFIIARTHFRFSWWWLRLTRSTSLSLFSVCVALRAFMNYDFIVAAGSQINESCRCKAARRRSGFLPRAALLRAAHLHPQSARAL